MPDDELLPRPQAARRAPWPHGTDGAPALLFAANPLPMWVYDLETLRFLEVNDAAVAHFGRPRAELLAMSVEQVRPAEHRTPPPASAPGRSGTARRSGLERHRRAGGELLEVEVTSQPLEWEGRAAALVVARDVTEIRRLQAELERRTLFDEATGLANAALFADRTTAALARAAGEHSQVGVLVVGLDGLEALAASAGDEAADAVVEETIERLRGCCRSSEMLARLGGGRFAVMCEARDDHAVLALASSVTTALSPPVGPPGVDGLTCAASVGVALAGGGDAASLVRDASAAMRHASERSGGHFIVSNTELRGRARETFTTEQALRHAVRHGELHLCYQPVVDLKDLEVVACEALVRWERPGRGLEGPDRFVPVAERSELIVELGAWVIEHAIVEAATWRERTGRELRVGVNLSARQLHDEHLVERFAAACGASGLSPSSVCAELTESAFVATDDYDAYRVLAALRETGIEVAIDDLGTGYSSLSYLKHLPVDVVKIDRGFVAGLGVDRADALIVEAVVHVAHGLGLRVVAEGVETESQLEAVLDLGCDAAQGYLLARPVRAEDLPSAIERARRVVAR